MKKEHTTTIIEHTRALHVVLHSKELSNEWVIFILAPRTLRGKTTDGLLEKGRNRLLENGLKETMVFGVPSHKNLQKMNPTSIF